MKSSALNSPAPWFISAVGAAVGLITAFAHLSTTQAAVLSSLAIAAGTIVFAIRTKPVAVATISGAVVIVITDLSLFGFPTLSSDQKGALVTVLPLVLGWFLHLIHVPASDTGKQ